MKLLVLGLDGATFKLLDPYDVDGMAEAVSRLIEDSALRQTMSQQAKELAESLSYKNVAAQTLILYNKLRQEKKNARK